MCANTLWNDQALLWVPLFSGKGLEPVRCEWGLMTLAYNLKRGLNLIRFEKLMAPVGGQVGRAA
jgi:hypothetical protein